MRPSAQLLHPHRTLDDVEDTRRERGVRVLEEDQADAVDVVAHLRFKERLLVVALSGAVHALAEAVQRSGEEDKVIPGPNMHLVLENHRNHH